jgi:hypothetical protein
VLRKFAVPERALLGNDRLVVPLHGAGVCELHRLLRSGLVQQRNVRFELVPLVGFVVLEQPAVLRIFGLHFCRHLLLIARLA